jgi:hypothetical protein
MSAIAWLTNGQGIGLQSIQQLVASLISFLPLVVIRTLTMARPAYHSQTREQRRCETATLPSFQDDDPMMRSRTNTRAELLYCFQARRFRFTTCS